MSDLNLGMLTVKKKNLANKTIPMKRRLSGVFLGKNLILNETSGLKL